MHLTDALVVGLTGGIGSGKSTVARLMGDLGAVVIDVDGVGRDVIAPGGRAEAAVLREFGAGIAAPDGSIHRPSLASIVFGDAAALARLEAISHPAIDAELEARVAASRADVVVLDMAVLVESRLGRDLYTTVVVVEAPLELRIRRAVERGMAEADARARAAAQATDEQRRAVADHVIVNDRDLDALSDAVTSLWATLTRP